MGKTTFLEHIWALPGLNYRPERDALELHRRARVDLIADISRERKSRGVTIADLHLFDPGDEVRRAILFDLSPPSNKISSDAREGQFSSAALLPRGQKGDRKRMRRKPCSMLRRTCVFSSRRSASMRRPSSSISIQLRTWWRDSRLHQNLQNKEEEHGLKSYDGRYGIFRTCLEVRRLAGLVAALA